MVVEDPEMPCWALFHLWGLLLVVIDLQWKWMIVSCQQTDNCPHLATETSLLWIALIALVGTIPSQPNDSRFWFLFYSWNNTNTKSRKQTQWSPLQQLLSTGARGSRRRHGDWGFSAASDIVMMRSLKLFVSLQSYRQKSIKKKKKGF